jgi:hypothetical protein
MITLDKNAIDRFREQGTREIFVRLIKKGCEGTKIEVLTHIPTDISVTRFETPDLSIACATSEAEKLTGSRLTQVGEKWIFTSAQVKGRCGCGTSFSFAGDPKKTPKEFVNISMLEAGTSHEIDSGNYFVYGNGVTQIIAKGQVRIYTLEVNSSSEVKVQIADPSSSVQLNSVVVCEPGATQSYTSFGEVTGT